MKLTSQKSLNSSKFSVLTVVESDNIQLPSNLVQFQDVFKIAVADNEITGKAKTATLLRGTGSIERLLVIGLGEAEKLSAESYREAAGIAGKEAKALHITSIDYIIPNADSSIAQALVEGTILSTYSFDELKNIKKPDMAFAWQSIQIISDADLSDAMQKAAIIATAMNDTRDLCNAPGNHLTPSIFAAKAEKMAKAVGLKATILGEKEMEAEKMFSLLSVSKGSDEEAKLIVLEHRPKGATKTITLVGKGLTFDAGGISIKPAANMHEMKMDMSGGAAVFGALKAIGELNLPINVVGIIPSSENLLNGSANKPGDIVTAKNGTTIEILNTDAEGRLILADALTYAERFKPDYVVDVATLTGAMVISLGDVVTGMMGTDQTLMDELKIAGEESHDRVWQLPLYEDYDQQLKSPVADIANIGGKGAGSITAAMFLSYFTREFKWAHLDIAGTAWSEAKKSYMPKGSAGAAVRLFVQFVSNQSK